jgi:hypothetical protein
MVGYNPNNIEKESEVDSDKMTLGLQKRDSGTGKGVTFDDNVEFHSDVNSYLTSNASSSANSYYPTPQHSPAKKPSPLTMFDHSVVLKDVDSRKSVEAGRKSIDYRHSMEAEVHRYEDEELTSPTTSTKSTYTTMARKFKGMFATKSRSSKPVIVKEPKEKIKWSQISILKFWAKDTKVKSTLDRTKNRSTATLEETLTKGSIPSSPRENVCDKCRGTQYFNRALCTECKGTGSIPTAKGWTSLSRRINTRLSLSRRSKSQSFRDTRVNTLDPGPRSTWAIGSTYTEKTGPREEWTFVSEKLERLHHDMKMWIYLNLLVCMAVVCLRHFLNDYFITE